MSRYQLSNYWINPTEDIEVVLELTAMPIARFHKKSKKFILRTNRIHPDKKALIKNLTQFLKQTIEKNELLEIKENKPRFYVLFHSESSRKSGEEHKYFCLYQS